MTILAGVDGCSFGWVCMTKDLENGTINSLIFRSSAELFAQTPTPVIFSIDIPIGLKVYEVHPEISFKALNGGDYIVAAKRNPKGESIRHSLVENHFGSGAFDEIRNNHYQKDVANHDINDTFAVLWTAERIFRGDVKVIPVEIEFDSVGLRMGIWY